MKKILSVFVVFLLTVLFASTVFATTLPISIDKVEVDGTVVSEGSTTRLDVVRDNEIEIEVEFYGTGNDSVHENIIMEVFISGYEYSDFEPIHDATDAFDVEGGVKYKKTLNLDVPKRLDSGDYKLRLMFTDANSDELIARYDLLIDVPRHSLSIKDVIFTPEGAVKAGKSLLTTVRVKNIGQKDEESVKIQVSVPALEISATDYIDEIEADDSVTSEELYMRVPSCAQAGEYQGKVTVTYDEGFESVSYPFTMNVLEGDACEIQSPATKTYISVSSETKDVSLTTPAVYPLTLTNAGTRAKTYTLSVDAGDWASVKVEPSNVLVLEEGESQTVLVYVTAVEGAQAGEEMFSITVSSDSEVLKEITMKANVVASAASAWDKVKSALEVGLIVLVVLVVLLFLILGFNKLRGEKDDEDFDDDETAQTYY